MIGSRIDLIVSQIVELSLEEKSSDEVRNIYSVSVDINLKLAHLMRDLRELERRQESNDKKTSN